LTPTELPGTGVTLQTDIANVTLDIDAAIPCGLIINELISNSLKHAFPADREGEIYISFTQTPMDGKNEYILTVSDNGLGIPGNIDIKQSKSLGLQLVTSLAEHQLQGTLDLNRIEGTTFSIRFSKAAPEKTI
jgi:two-component sensor histidine kinase